MRPAGFEAFDAHGGHQFGTHRIAGVRRRGRVDAEAVGHRLQFPDAVHHGAAILRFGAEDLQEGAGVHRVAGLDGEGVVAVGDVGHSHDALLPHAVHLPREVIDLLLQGLVVPHLIDLVDESGHAGALAELALQIGEFNVAVRIDKTRSDRAVVERRFGGGIRAHACPDDGSVILHLHEPVPDGFRRGKRI